METALCVVGAVPSRLRTTFFRSGELRLPLPALGATLAPLSLAYAVHSADAGRGWGMQAACSPRLGEGVFPVEGFRSPVINRPSELIRKSREN